MEGLNAWGEQPRVVQNHTIDSTRWREFKFRDSDIVVATWAKSGTTWVQQILSQLLFNGAEQVPVLDISLWVDWRAYSVGEMLGQVESQSHRRFVKTHLPADALVYSPDAKYLYVGRDGRDVVWSWHHHHLNLMPIVYEVLDSLPPMGPRLGPPQPDFQKFFHEWLDRDGFPLWPFWSHVQSWWEMRKFPNVTLVHFNDLKKDLPGEIRRIARFLSAEIDETCWPRILEHCSFEYMKRTASQLSPALEAAFVGGARSFVNRGATGSWRYALSPADVRKYERHVAAHLTPEAASWLAEGSLARSDSQYRGSALSSGQ